jgi:DNA primase large subunit
MSDIYDLVKRYPWLPSLKTYYSDIASTEPLEFINRIFTSDKSKILKIMTLKIFNDAFNNIEQISEYHFDETNIYIYLLLRILLYILNNKILSNRVANIYSKTTYSELNKENEYNLYYIYKDLDLDVLYEENETMYKKIIVKDQQEIYKTNFKISYIDYLKFASNLKDEYRKLVNNALLQGYVYIKAEQLNRLLQEHVRMKILTQNIVDSNHLDKLKADLFKVQDFKDLFDSITEIWESKKEEFEYSLDITYKEGKDISESFPPCIKEILTKAQEGQNLIHTERLYILWILNALKYPEEKIVDVFSTLPDFDREKTAYQVKYAIKKGYSPYSCKSLKSYTLCMANKYKDKLCLEGYFSKKLQVQRQISHPLFYINLKQYKSPIKENSEKKKNEKDG